MALTYEQPGVIGFCRSPILYAVYEATFADVGFYYTCDVYLWQSGSKPASATYSLEKYPTPNGAASFNIQSLAKDYFINPQHEFTTPDDTESSYVNCAVTLNWTDDVGSGAPVVLSEFFIMNGYNYYLDGLNYITDSHLGVNYASAFALRVSADGGTLEAPDCVDDELLGLSYEGYWMTDRPSEMDIPIDTSMRQYFKRIAGNTLNIVVNINDRDKIIKTDISAYTKKVTSFGVGGTEIQALATANSFTDTITTYDVYLEDSDENIYGQTYTFNVIEPCRFGFRNLQFMNRYGVWDNIIIYGTQIEKLDVERKEIFNSPLEVSTAAVMTTNDPYGQFHMSGISGRESLTVNTGWISEDYNEVLKQLMLTEHLFDPDTSQPFTIDTKSLTVKTALNNGLSFYTFDLKQAHTAINSVY